MIFFLRGFCSLTLALSLSACALPRGGPSTKDIVGTDAASGIQITSIDQYKQLERLTFDASTMPAAFRNARPPALDRLALGDELTITLSETSGNGDFPISLTSPLTIRNVVIGQNGNIEVPYAGSVQAAGFTPAKLSRNIRERLRGLLYRAQVSVYRTSSPYSSVTIQGAVSKGGAFPISPQLNRLSTLIGVAGFQQEPDRNYMIEIRRNGKIGRVSPLQLYSDPQMDVALFPGDVVAISSSFSYFTILGAVNMPGRLPLPRASYSLMDALGNANGLNDLAADPTGIFVFRSESVPGQEEPKNVIYQMNVREPRHIFVANGFVMQQGDVIYVSNAPFTQTQKILSSISQSLGFVSLTAQAAIR